MVVTLFAAHGRPGADLTEEYRLAFGREILESLANVPGFISYNVYACLDDKTAWMGVVRWESREAMLAWREDKVHRAVFHRINEFYTDFNIQHTEVYREMFFREGQRLEPESSEFYRERSIDFRKPPTFADIYGQPMPEHQSERT
jgi:heme-degrading monooxygenase HmoA